MGLGQPTVEGVVRTIVGATNARSLVAIRMFRG